MISLFAAFCTALIPVPSRQTGIKYGPKSAPVNIEVFVDITCPYCAMIFRDIKNVLAAYPTQVNVVYHFFELPSHTWSYVVTRSLYACNKESEEFGHQMLEGLLGNNDQSQFYASTLADKGEGEVQQLAENYAISQTGIDRKTFKLNYDDLGVVQTTRIEFKYTLIRNIKGTPTVFINGVVDNDIGAGSSLDEWKKLIDSLLN